jgi:hypothetical protein
MSMSLDEYIADQRLTSASWLRWLPLWSGARA